MERNIFILYGFVKILAWILPDYFGKRSELFGLVFGMHQIKMI
jgi:hypothetical protein